MNDAIKKLTPCQVKICGIREPADAAAMDTLSVDWVGFNFYSGSSRYITPEQATPLIRSLGRPIPVGVFVDADIDYVIRVANLTGIRFAQLHGNEDWAYVQKVPVPVIKAIPHTRLADLGGMRDGLAEATARGEGSNLKYFLVDTQAGGKGFGGSGLTFDWTELQKHTWPLPYFLAGGLGPQNLQAALAAGIPFAVDLNSKVEIEPGKKDLLKVKACIDIVRGQP